MNSEKLNKAAKEAANDIIGGYDPDFPELSLLDLRDECCNSFCNGAKWLLTQPLSSRLTEEEKAKIKEVYWQAASDWIGIGDARGHCRTCVALESIFGTSLFNEKCE